VVGEDLSMLLRTDRVDVTQWRTARVDEFQVDVEVGRFEGSVGGDVVLDARWRVLGRDGEVALKRSTIREATGKSGYGALVAAMSRALGALGRDIGVTKESLPR
jgi:uncharacterized lipoprotein YmbA